MGRQMRLSSPTMRGFAPPATPGFGIENIRGIVVFEMNSGLEKVDGTDSVPRPIPKPVGDTFVCD